MTSIDDVKARIDILDLMAEAGVKLRRSGRNYIGFCPFHDNKHTPAFVVWPESGTWRCFSECNEGGDIFKFVMKKEGWDFKEALQRLAERAGVTLERLRPEAPAQKEAHARLRSLLEEAAQFYQRQLLSSAEGQSALNYLLQRRGLTRETIETWQLGYAPQGFDNTRSFLLQKGYTEAEMIDSGLVSVREAESPGEKRRIFDRFHYRIIIPIRDENSRLCGFGARIHPADSNKEQAKFINTAETPLFSKGHLLYGLHLARKAIRQAEEAVIVEGYLDVIAVHQAGFANVVSPMGTALTGDQLRLLKRFARRMTLALDPDAAGQKAVLRGLEAARSALDRSPEHAFDARGLLQHEARLQTDLRVVTLPDGLDPDEVVARSPEEWKTLVAQARPIVEHVLESLLADWDGRDPKRKSAIAAQMLPLIEDLPDPLVRDTYFQMLARRLKVDENALLQMRSSAARKPLPRSAPRRVARQAESAPQAALTTPAPSALRRFETACLSLLLLRPELLPRLERRLQEAGLAPLNDADFEYTDYRFFLSLLHSAQEQDSVEAPQFVRQNLPEYLTETYASLVRGGLPPGSPERSLDELTRLILQRRQQALRESISQARFLLEEAQQNDPQRLPEYQQQSLQYQRSLAALDVARQKMDATRKG